ncbi:MAG: YggT family protein [Pseudanabaena sp. ELA748]
MQTPSFIIAETVGKFLQIYSILLIVRILLTWFRTVDWYKQPFATLSQVTDPYLNLFRSIIPPLGGMDFSPILAFLALNLMQSAVGLIARNVMGF